MVYTVHCKMYSVQKLPGKDETSEATVKNIYVFIISLMISLAVIFPKYFNIPFNTEFNKINKDGKTI